MHPYKKDNFCWLVYRDKVCRQQEHWDDLSNPSQMKRIHTELVSWLTKELGFPYGAFLMTGTGIVPPDDLTLLPGDVGSIIIPCIGILTNNVSI